MVSPETRKAIEAVLSDQLGAIGFDHAVIAEDIDLDGRDALSIDVHYRRIGASVDPTPTFSLTRHVRQALRDIGDMRFPYLLHHFPDDQDLKVVA